jgi:hypothetical protein
MGFGETFRSNGLFPGIALGEAALNVTLTADNQLVNPGRLPFLRLTSDNATSTNRTFSLTNGAVDGQVLSIALVGSSSNKCELLSTGNVTMTGGTWTASVGDTLTLQWDQLSAVWREKGRGVVAATYTSGRYTPTVTAGTNVVSGSAISSFYLQVGTIVYVNIQSLVVCTAATNTASVISFDLPIASNIGATTDVCGVAARLSATGTDYSVGTVSGVIATDLARVDFNAQTTASSIMTVTFSYEII